MARWYMVSYDAANELYEPTLTENSVQRGLRARNFENTDDFRKVVIRILRTKLVTTMREPVKTTIVFLDPSPGSEAARLNYWFDAFRTLGDNFKFVVAAILQEENGNPFTKEFPDQTLNANFQRLLREVLAEERRV